MFLLELAYWCRKNRASLLGGGLHGYKRFVARLTKAHLRGKAIQARAVLGLLNIAFFTFFFFEIIGGPGVCADSVLGRYREDR
jgi:hypothetical protein